MSEHEPLTSDTIDGMSEADICRWHTHERGITGREHAIPVDTFAHLYADLVRRLMGRMVSMHEWASHTPQQRLTAAVKTICGYEGYHSPVRFFDDEASDRLVTLIGTI
jgi:hypothetical protein